MTQFRFESNNVKVTTTEMVQSCLARRKGCWVTGHAGSGKTHAVREAVNGAVWISLDNGGPQHARFLVDLARQVPGGTRIVSAIADGRLDEGRSLATDLLAGRTLVVDRAERLADSVDWDWDEPLHAIAQAENAGLRTWLIDHACRHPTVIVSRGGARVDGSLLDHIVHRASEDWPIKLTWADGGARNWWALADRVGHRPAGLVLARAIIPLLNVDAFHDLVDQLAREDEGPVSAFRALSKVFRERAPASWHVALAAVAALDDAEQAIVEDALAETERPALNALLRLGLVEKRRSGRLGVLSTLEDSQGLRDLEPVARGELLNRLALAVLRRVNDPMSLDPVDADRVLRAHSLYVDLGDFENAQRTARVYVHGLIDLARRTSLAGMTEAARRQYESIRDLIKRSDADDGVTRRTRSYVVHYHAYNGQRAKTLPKERILSDYEEAASLWPENALWHLRMIALLIELGRLNDASQAIKRAYSPGHVTWHPRRDTFLRIRPALEAHRHGAPVFGLELIEPVVEEISWDVDPEGAASIDELLAKWSEGVEVEELPYDRGVLVFTNRERLQVDRLVEAWQARWAELDIVGAGQTPVAAVRAVARAIADEAERLIRTPSHELPDGEVDRKAAFIAHLDPLNSDIGLEHARERWLLGTIESGSFRPAQRDYGCIPIHEGAPGLPDNPRGLYFARVPVFRDGYPRSGVEEVIPAGSERSLKEILRELRDQYSDPSDGEP